MNLKKRFILLLIILISIISMVGGDFQEAMAEIKALQGIIPICSYCKQVRNDQGFWQDVEMYLNSHTEASLNHCICLDCLK